MGRCSSKLACGSEGCDNWSMEEPDDWAATVHDMVESKRCWDDTAAVTDVPDGFWYRLHDNKCIGEVVAGMMIWHSLCQEVPPTSQLTPVEGSDYVVLRLRDQRWMGHVSCEAQAKIAWSNGEVWLRK
mmetsp:Transcript_37493/g.69916  ORF Transcript_37493/g.69916 Transcript_37493/m.69916 type:complete len:128 (+) Transcript_37493:43-426(+)